MREKLTAEMKSAMKNGDKARLSTIRLIQAAIKDRDIAARTKSSEVIGEDEILETLAKMVKQRNDSITQYKEAGRDELAAQEEAEIAVISEFLPEQMNEEDTKAAIQKVIADTGAESVRDMGKVMGALKGAYAGQMDFGKASGLVKELLAS